jgi:putative hydrolase
MEEIVLNELFPRYRIEADLHSHTTASTHAYGTLAENAQAAFKAGLGALAITNHGPLIQDGAHPWHFYNMRVLPEKIDGVTIWKGIEANIMDVKGTLDLEEGYLKKLDWVIASFHKQTFPVADFATHTEALLAVIHNRYVDLIGHPDAPEYPFDIRKVVQACKEKGKMIEMNNSSFFVRKGGEQICRQIALECMEEGVSVVVNSDAHCPWDIGKVFTVCGMLESLSFPESLIFNCKADLVKDYILEKKAR